MDRVRLDDPARTAVLVVDIQPLFTQMPLFPSVDDVLQRLREFVDRARAVGATIIAIRVAIPKELYSDVWEAQFPDFAPSIAPDSPLAQFHPGFAPTPSDLAIEKTRYSAFIGTTLEAVLRTRGINTVVAAGLTTDVCASSTARDAFQRDFHVITLPDCTAEQTPERHEAGLSPLRANFGRVMTSDELLALWGVSAQIT